MLSRSNGFAFGDLRSIPQVLAQMGDLVWTLGPGHETLASLVDRLAHVAEEFLKPTSIQLTLEFPDALPNLVLRSEPRNHLLMMVQEALRNVVQHSGATRVTVALAIDGQILNLKVADNGNGISPEAKERSRGNGLRNLHDRAQALGGQLVIDSHPTGTRLLIRVSL